MTLKAKRDFKRPDDGTRAFTIRMPADLRKRINEYSWRHDVGLGELSALALEGFLAADPRRALAEAHLPFGADLEPEERDVLQSVLELLRSDRQDTIRILKMIVENWRTVS